MIRALPIGSVALETGIQPATLRKWEQRYGFPAPVRGPGGARVYPDDQITRLVEIKRRIEGGERTANAITQSLPTGKPTRSVPTDTPGIRQDALGEALHALRAHDMEALRRILERELVRQGLQRFVQGMLANLAWEVGEAWARGELMVYEEHLFSEALLDLLARRTPAFSDAHGSPRVVLATPPGELHTLGLVMLKACLEEAGARCIHLGAQTPPGEVAAAAEHFAAEIVCLSVSAAYPQAGVGVCEYRGRSHAGRAQLHALLADSGLLPLI